MPAHYESDDAGRCPANWVALQALESLTPPSPSPSLGTDMLSSLCSFGEIPIILDAGLDLDAYEFTETDRTEEELTSDMVPVESRIVSREAEAVATHGSVQLLGFGVADPGTNQTTHRTCLISGHSALPDASRSSGPKSGHHGCGFLTESGDSQFSISAYLVSSLAYEDHGSMPSADPAHAVPSVSPRMTPVGSAETSPVGSPCSTSFVLLACDSELEGSVLAENVVARGAFHGLSPNNIGCSRSSSTLFTTLSGSESFLSPSPSTVSTSTDVSPLKLTRDYFRSKLRKSKSCSPLPLGITGARPAGVADISIPASAPVTPVLPTFDLPRMSHRRTDSTATSNSTRSTRSARSSHISSPLASPVMKSRQLSNLPEILGWLRNVNIELWIDQEGSPQFRPTFKLMGYTSETSSDRDLELVNALTYGLADYIPVTRQVFIVNNGKADVSPILRRLTMAGDESKDYISQHASLLTTSNGVYTVSGTELFDTQATQAPLVLKWKFEYFVQDSLAEPPDIVLQGEKMLTPLRFSCSPGLLHPTHGKKRTFLQLFRRSSSVNLYAEKMKAPRPGTALAIGSDTVKHPNEVSDTKPVFKDAHSPGLGLGFPSHSGLQERHLHSPNPGYGLRRSPKLTHDPFPPSTLTGLVSVYADSLLTAGDEYHRPRQPYCRSTGRGTSQAYEVIPRR